MQNRLEISIGKKYKDAFDEFKAFADISCTKLSPLVGEAIKDYMMNVNNQPKIVLDKKLWDLSKYSKKELEEMNTLISELNRKIIEELCQR